MKKSLVVLSLLLAVVLMTAGPVFSQVNFVKLGYVPETGHTFVGWADLDHNEINELTYLLKSPSISRSYEYVPLTNPFGISKNPFRFRADYNCGVKALGDSDDDGRSEIIYQYGQEIRILESQSAVGFPDTVVWTAALGDSISFFAQITDLDGNNTKEICITGNSLASDPGPGGDFAIYENTNGNNYVCVFNSSWLTLFHKQWVGPFVIGDFNGDGADETALSSLYGEIGIVKHIGNGYYWGDVVYNLPILNSYQLTKLNDVNNNGRDEFVVGGWEYGVGWYYGMLEYNPTTDSYQVLHEWRFTGGGSYACAAGDTDGDGRDELALGSGSDIYLYDFVADAVEPRLIYTFQGSIAPGIGIYAYFYDIDSDGDFEILFDNRDIDQLEIYKRDDNSIGIGSGKTED
ncbi:MAG: hypothetical protein GY950_03040 [bacterium]|nr:hypothetical protein [bacterium]